MADFLELFVLANPPADLKLAMKSAGEAAYPNEACGLVIKVGKKSKVIECANVAEFKTCQFRISAEDFAKASDAGEVIGVWHTHCDNPETPSEADLAACESSEVTWYIMSVWSSAEGILRSSDVFVLTATGFEMPYLERPYVFGTFDCYSLAKDYYRREFGILMGSYPHIDNWSNLGHNFLALNYSREGFVSLVEQEPKVGDLFLIQSGASVPNHVAIYLGSEIIMHQMHGRLSRKDVYGGYWLKHTAFHLRHTTKC